MKYILKYTKTVVVTVTFDAPDNLAEQDAFDALHKAEAITTGYDVIEQTIDALTKEEGGE